MTRNSPLDILYEAMEKNDGLSFRVCQDDYRVIITLARGDYRQGVDFDSRDFFEQRDVEYTLKKALASLKEQGE